nr:EOG090X04O4 [Sida crystallina]
MGFRSHFLLFSTLVLLPALVIGADSDLTIKNAERTIDVSSQLAKITHRLTLSNNDKTPVKNFKFDIEPKVKDNLSFFKAQLTDGKVLTAANNGGSYTVELKDALEAGKTVKVQVEIVLTHYLAPHPAEITQKEKQLVQYRGNAYLYSPYKVVTQTTKILLSSSNVEGYTKVKPSSQSDSTVTYGPYDNIAPHTEESVVVHYENNSPFLSVSSLLRHIEVSHWGNIAIEETVDVYHGGAKLKGSFSRFEYQREQSGVSSVKNFKTLLPPSASDVYYRDEIGNISTSNLREGDDNVELELRPRFPLFGGWKTHYVVGYNVPSYEFLFSSGNDFVLQVKVIDHIFDDMIVDDALIRVVLPEGSSNIELDAPYAVTRLPDSLHFTYLDTKGRPVVEISAKNLVENHIQDFKLHYTFSRVLMFQEPLLCVLAFFLLFLTVIVYVRLDFSITKDEVNESRLRTAGIVESIRSRQNKRSSLFNQFEEHIVRLKSSKDLNVFQASTKTIKDELKIYTVNEMVANLKPENAALAEKVADLQKYDKMLKELLTSHGALVEKLVSGKMNKQQFIDMEAGMIKKKDEHYEKMKAILANF